MALSSRLGVSLDNQAPKLVSCDRLIACLAFVGRIMDRAFVNDPVSDHLREKSGQSCLVHASAYPIMAYAASTRASTDKMA